MAACAAIFAATVAPAQMDPVAREPLIAPGVSVPRPPGSIPGVAVSGPAPVAAPPARKQRSYPDSRSAIRAAMTDYGEGRKSTAAEALSFAAEQGDPRAAWKLGKMYAAGDGVPVDPLTAFEHFSRVADEYADIAPDSQYARFVATAFVALGSYFLDGIPKTYVKANPAKAREMFHYAATQFGDPDAQYNLARMYMDGIGGAKDAKQAARWLNLAAEKNHPPSQAILGNLLINGQGGIPRQPTRGLVLLERALETADPVRDKWIVEMHGKAFAATTSQDHDAAKTYIENRLKRQK
ncbi:MAG: tetratricopeptide repeat protein [Beijerinckiaceae bacterium]